MILVEPEHGLSKVDREFYILQSEFYTTGRFGEKGVQSLNLDDLRDERPHYVVFNGRAGSLMGERSLKAKVGETIRLYVGVGGPNLVSSFHVIGEVFDAVLNAKVFAHYAVGYNNIDVAEAKKRGITITNTPGALTEAVAEHTIALLLSLARRIPAF